MEGAKLGAREGVPHNSLNSNFAQSPFFVYWPMRGRGGGGGCEF